MHPLAHVHASLAQVLRTYGRERLELEFRLGHRFNGFVPGVSQQGWEALKAVLDVSEAFTMEATTTREIISDDGSGGKYVVPEAGGKAHWMHKKRLCDIDIDTASAWCCRVSMSLEEVGDARPPPASHRFERHKERYSYKHRCWSLDLTRVVSNLPHQLDNDGVSYEVELELVDTAELFVRPVDNLLEWAWKIVGDVCGMLSGEQGDARPPPSAVPPRKHVMAA